MKTKEEEVRVVVSEELQTLLVRDSKNEKNIVGYLKLEQIRVLCDYSTIFLTNAMYFGEKKTLLIVKGDSAQKKKSPH